jgi:hypothetical protein
MLLHNTSIFYRRAVALLLRHASLDSGRALDPWAFRPDTDLSEVMHVLRQIADAPVLGGGVARAAMAIGPVGSGHARSESDLERALHRARRLLRLGAGAELLVCATVALGHGDLPFHDQATALVVGDLVAAHRERFQRVDLPRGLVPAALDGRLLRILGLPHQITLEAEQEIRLVEPLAQDAQGAFVYLATNSGVSPLFGAQVPEAADRLFRRVASVEDVCLGDLSTELAETFGIPDDPSAFQLFWPGIQWSDDPRTRLERILRASIKDFSPARTVFRMPSFAPLAEARA